MRSTWKVLGAAASLVLLPQLAAASSIEEQMEVMQQRMSQLEDQLQATNDDLYASNKRVERQQVVLDNAGLEEGGAISGLSSFLSDTDFYGWVNASYTQNFRRSPTTLPYHGTNQNFAVNQVWFGMDRASTPESRAGFHIDMLYGTDAGGTGGLGGDDSDFELFTAYVSYLAPIGNGVEIQAGKLGTLLGAEVVQTTMNFNITRGILWGLQPINNVGLMVSSDLGGGLSLSAGVLNDSWSYSGSMDANPDKSFAGQLAWSNDTFGAAVSGIWGYNQSGAGATGILDVVLTADPADNVSLWLNYDYISHSNITPSIADTHGFALAGRVGITDNTGVSLRGEYVTLTKGGADTWSITATADHHLTDNFMVRGEIRYDGASPAAFGFGGNPGVLPPNGALACPPCKKDQWVAIIDATFEF